MEAGRGGLTLSSFPQTSSDSEKLVPGEFRTSKNKVPSAFDGSGVGEPQTHRERGPHGPLPRRPPSASAGPSVDMLPVCWFVHLSLSRLPDVRLLPAAGPKLSGPWAAGPRGRVSWVTPPPHRPDRLPRGRFLCPGERGSETKARCCRKWADAWEKQKPLRPCPGPGLARRPHRPSPPASVRWRLVLQGPPWPCLSCDCAWGLGEGGQISLKSPREAGWTLAVCTRLRPGPRPPGGSRALVMRLPRARHCGGHLGTDWRSGVAGGPPSARARLSFPEAEGGPRERTAVSSHLPGAPRGNAHLWSAASRPLRLAGPA